MLKQFSILNAKMWWRSLKAVEAAAILFYAVFVALAAGQFIGVIVLLLFTSDVERAQSIYPWLTQDVHLFANYLFVNVLWFTQFFFTKISRLRLNENRKLLSFGLPAQKLTHYLNLAGFLHPMNLMFQLFWAIYLGLLAETAVQYVAIGLIIIVNYGFISVIKWRVRRFTAERFKIVSGITISVVSMAILMVYVLDLKNYPGSIQDIASVMLDWMYYSPGYLFYYIGAGLTGGYEQFYTIFILTVLAWLLHKDLYLNTKAALLSPPRSSVGSDDSGQLSFFMKWLGREGGKFFYSVWNHKYSRIQLLITYIFVIPYVVFLGDSTYMIGVLLTLIPIIYLMVMLTNMFGFENRELLLSLQMPIEKQSIVTQRITTSLLIGLAGSSVAFILVPIFVDALAVVIQMHMGIILICLVFLLYNLNSCIVNYKKIEEVSVMSVSNPVLPVSMTFTALFIVMILGIFTFIVIEGYEWMHVAGLIAVNIILSWMVIRKVRSMPEPFKSQVIPNLWNEL